MTNEIIRDMFHLIDAGDYEALRTIFTDDVVYERPGYEAIRGIDALVHFYRVVRVIGSGEHRLTAVVADGPVAVSWGRFVGARRDGDPVDVRFADVYTFASHRIRTRTSFFFVPAV